jgi:hypothetical protein
LPDGEKLFERLLITMPDKITVGDAPQKVGFQIRLGLLLGGAVASLEGIGGFAVFSCVECNRGSIEISAQCMAGRGVSWTKEVRSRQGPGLRQPAGRK